MTWLLLLAGCLTISSGEHEDRIDQDGDGLGLDRDCDDSDPDVQIPQWFVDADGDGWGSVPGAKDCTQPSGHAAVGGDCDDTDPTRNPGAAEYCDGIDNDCDGATDDDEALDAVSWFPDSDGDGFGDGRDETVRCAGGDGWVSDSSDCDDTNPAVNPAARETCDGVDTDCTGEPDDVRWWEDGDGDGYGDPESEVIACTAPEGFVAYQDCDDQDPEIHPAAEEWCHDTVDNDCDTAIDEDSAADAALWYRDADEDGYGRLQDKVQACDQPSGYVADDRDCDDEDDQQHPAATETWYDGVDQDCDGGDDYDADGDGFRSESQAGGADCDDQAGSVHPDASEACGDGIDNDCSGDQLGACALEGELSLPTDATATWLGLVDETQLGLSVQALGDLDGDGELDFALGHSDGITLLEGAEFGVRTLDPRVEVTACYGACDGSGSGAEAQPAGDLDGDGVGDVWVIPSGGASEVYGLSGASAGPVDLTSGSLTGIAWNGESVFNHIAGGHDADGDGVWDLAVSGVSGPVYVLWAPTGDADDISDADVRITHDDSSEYFGRAMTWVGDMDGDGLPELAVGAPWSALGGTYSGAVYLFRGGELIDGTASDLGEVLSRSSGHTELAYMGLRVAGVGDTDGDGLAELLVGANEGGASLVRGLSSGTLPDDAVAHFVEGARTDRVGQDVGSAGDVNGDGLPDLLIGDWGLETEFGQTRGGALLFLSPCEGTLDTTVDAEALLLGEDGNGKTGDALGTVGDLNHDGFDDIVVGAYRTSTLGSAEGAAYLLLGGVD